MQIGVVNGMTITIGWLIALLVLILAILGLVGVVPFSGTVIFAFIIGLAAARLL